ncbi:PilZ domain-containing protein [Oceanobacillus salinisoli]|uniref:PilZ domain-containing protein n=1 Tax=Oceanobacillus salinisoli TaxID=2678611 RepID=UPI0012E29CCE|nr:PilZ domain-containing protein [Oceanobacillus salinisoli]
MRYKRDEPFRYTFGIPIPASFKILKIENKMIDSSKGEAKIIDVSPEGAKLNSELELPSKPVQITITFKLNGKEFNVIGNVMWKKPVGVTFDYGIQLEIDEDHRRELIEHLKLFSKNAMDK